MGTGGRAAVLLAMLVLVAASVGGCYPHGGELGTDHLDAHFETDLTLSGVAPVAVRHLTFNVAPAPSMSGADVTVRVSRSRDDDAYEQPKGVSVCVRPDDPERLRPRGPAYELVPGAQLAFDLQCSEGCTQGATIIVRSSAATDVDVRLLADVRVIARSYAEPTLSGSPGIREDVDRAINGPPLGPTVSAASPIDLPAGSSARIVVRLHADAEEIHAANAGGLVGSMILLLDGDSEARTLLSARETALAQVALGSQSMTIWRLGTPVDVDWLAACPAAGDCDASIEVKTSYEMIADAVRSNATFDNITNPPVPDSFRLQAEATAILEALDGRTIAPDAISVSVERTR